MANVLNYSAVIGGRRTTLDLAIEAYVRSFTDYMNEGGAGEILFPTEVKETNEGRE